MSALWSSDRPEFTERIAALAGGTTYRTPVAGRGTKQDQLPDEHAIATALAFSRRGPDDIGPDVAYCWALQTDAYRERVTRKMAVALSCHTLRNIRPHLLELSCIAWDTMIHERKGLGTPPAGVSSVPWGRGLLAALDVMHRSAWDALAEAERRYHRAA